jgi:hypothetical protein
MLSMHLCLDIHAQHADKKGLLFGWRVCTCVGRWCVSPLVQPALHLARPLAPHFQRLLCPPIHLLLLSSKTVSPFPFLEYLGQRHHISQLQNTPQLSFFSAFFNLKNFSKSGNTSSAKFFQKLFQIKTWTSAIAVFKFIGRPSGVCV